VFESANDPCDGFRDLNLVGSRIRPVVVLHTAPGKHTSLTVHSYTMTVASRHFDDITEQAHQLRVLLVQDLLGVQTQDTFFVVTHAVDVSIYGQQVRVGVPAGNLLYLDVVVTVFRLGDGGAVMAESELVDCAAYEDRRMLGFHSFLIAFKKFKFS
jgi:hypothetical protein